MKPAMDCTDQTKHINPLELFTVGELADALIHRGYDCNLDTVKNFITKRKIEPVMRKGGYRLFDRATLDLMRTWLKKRGKLKRA